MKNELIHEPQIKCEYCGEYNYKEESFRVKNDDNDYCEICESCYQGCIE